ncbi:hypothetical protein ACMFMF_003498 [Clarireedia jacksonii]
MNTFKPTNSLRSFSFTTQLFNAWLKQETGYEIELPLFLANPDPNTFMHATMMYGIFAMVYFILHNHHRYQHSLATSSIVASIIFSFWSQPHSGAIRAITTTMPMFLSFTLGFSNALHSLVGPRSYTKEERVCRALDLWASELMNVNTSDVDEKDSMEKNSLSNSVLV